MYEATRIEYPADMPRAPEERAHGLVESTARELLDSWERYARQKPASAALWALGIGFVLGWKLKLW
jgi:hypothetical protein